MRVKERLTQKAVFLRAASAAVALLAMLVAAPAALAAPRVSIVDSAGEAAAHRNSAVGSAAKEYTASVKGADAAGATYRWSSSDPGAVSVTGSGAAVSVEPVSEGVATVSVRVRLADGAELSDSLLFGAWTRLGYRAAGALTSDAPLTRGALADEDAAFVRCTGRAGQGLAVVGRLGAFWRVELPEGFDYGDGSPNMASFAPASAAVREG